jgi:hypothetical protein
LKAEFRVRVYVATYGCNGRCVVNDGLNQIHAQILRQALPLRP